ncbi:hypothetical protein OIU78_017591 [Salix suchowensis]|nr:hypothetical protein OIU78_017591 [Salix suchowensis]
MPEDMMNLSINEKCKIGSTPQNDWYFFSHKDKKYPTGTRTNRATAAGFWKATGRDKIIYSGFKRIGLRKTLVFYRGRAPHGQKSDWIMHEYRLDDNTHDNNVSNPIGEGIPEEGWVVCRVFRKKNYQKTLESPKSSSSSLDSKAHQILGSGNDGVLDQILLYMGRTCKMENETFSNMNISNNNSSLSPSFDQDRSFKSCYQQSYDEMLTENEPSSSNQIGNCAFEMISSSVIHDSKSGQLNDWVTLDRLVASQLNGQESETSKHLSCFSTDPENIQANTSNVYANENDLWGFAKSPSPSSSSDPLCHLSV